MLDRHQITIFAKENVLVLIKRLYIYGCTFSFCEMVYFLAKKQQLIDFF